jgi:hypothetical protein
MTLGNTLLLSSMTAMKIAPKIKIKKKNHINLNNTVKSELPFTEKEILNILRIVDAALADEKIESEIRDWLNVLHDKVSFDDLDNLHKKVSLFLNEK